jgi:hypothetical protein
MIRTAFPYARRRHPEIAGKKKRLKPSSSFRRLCLYSNFAGIELAPRFYGRR